MCTGLQGTYTKGCGDDDVVRQTENGGAKRGKNYLFLLEP